MCSLYVLGLLSGLFGFFFETRFDFFDEDRLAALVACRWLIMRILMLWWHM